MQTASLLKKVGDENAFQIFSIAFVCAKWLVVSLMIFLPSYLFIIPTFTCGEQTNVKEVDACLMISSCQINQPYTITATAGLYCDQKFTRNSILSAEFVGSVIGLILLSMLADHLGRKFIIITTLAISLAGTCIMTLGTNYVIYPFIYLGIIMMGFGGYSLSMVSYSYLSQISSDIWRQRSLVMTYSFWGLGQIMLYPIITLMKDWSDICIYILIFPLLILLILSFFITEPPEFLYTKKKYQECLLSLNYIAKFNKQPLLENLDGAVQSKEQAFEIKDTFTQSRYIIPLMVLSFAQVCNNGYYYTIQFSLEEYGYRFQTNMLFIGILQFSSCFFTNFYCHKMKRQFWIIRLMMVSGACGICLQIFDAKFIQLFFIGLSRLSNTVAFSLFSLITAETFPTSIRSTGLGITEAMSNFGNMAAPFLVTFAQVIHIKAVVAGGFLNVGGGLSMLFVKQTKLDTEQGEEKQNIFKQTKDVQLQKVNLKKALLQKQN